MNATKNESNQKLKKIKIKATKNQDDQNQDNKKKLDSTK